MPNVEQLVNVGGDFEHRQSCCKGHMLNHGAILSLVTHVRDLYPKEGLKALREWD